MGQPSVKQLERHIRNCAENDINVRFVSHAISQMQSRLINRPMVMEVLKMGCIYRTPEPDIRFTGLKCRMERFVAGMDVAVVVAIEYQNPELTVITVIDITKD